MSPDVRIRSLLRVARTSDVATATRRTECPPLACLPRHAPPRARLGRRDRTAPGPAPGLPRPRLRPGQQLTGRTGTDPREDLTMRYAFIAPAAPRTVRAASLGLAIARHTGHRTWADLVAATTEGDPETLLRLAEVEVDPADSDLLADRLRAAPAAGDPSVDGGRLRRVRRVGARLRHDPDPAGR